MLPRFAFVVVFN